MPKLFTSDTINTFFHCLRRPYVLQHCSLSRHSSVYSHNTLAGFDEHESVWTALVVVYAVFAVGVILVIAALVFIWRRQCGVRRLVKMEKRSRLDNVRENELYEAGLKYVRISKHQLARNSIVFPPFSSSFSFLFLSFPDYLILFLFFLKYFQWR